MRLFPAVLTLFLAVSPARAEVPKVLVSIAPLAGIAATVMTGVGTPDLLISSNASPHTYQLKPSDAAKLEQAGIIVWVGEGLETFLEKPITTLAKNATVIELADEPTLTHLPNRSGGAWEPEAEEHEAHETHQHNHGASDPHLWLDPDNAIAIALLLARQLAAKDPAHKTAYEDNAKAFARSVHQLDRELAAKLAPLQKTGFIVFHDAYQYFEQHYGLKGVGAITLSPEVAPSAARLAALQARMKSDQVQCVLAEPQFRDVLLDTLITGTSARKGMANVDASDLPVTPDLYQQYLRRLASQFAACLKG